MTAAVRRLPLEPPYTPSGYASAAWRAGLADVLGRQVPIERFAPLVRSRMAKRWHRPRYGARRVTPDGRPDGGYLHLWCGQSTHLSKRPLTADRVPDGEPLCGTCEGRAIGAGHPAIAVVETSSDLLFEPMRPTPPKVCPAVRYALLPPRELGTGWPMAVACPVCRELVPVRCHTRGYGDTNVRPQSHPPGPGLVSPCPFHGWDALRVDQQGGVYCVCQGVTY